MKVKMYEATVYYKSTGSSNTKNYQFTEDQAKSINSVLDVDGINVNDAIKLIEKWNRCSKKNNTCIYKYNLTFEDSIKYHE